MTKRNDDVNIIAWLVAVLTGGENWV